MKNARPEGHRFKDLATEVVWAGIEALDEGGKRAVLDQLREHLRSPKRETTAKTREARAIAALCEAAEILGGCSPSVKDYRELRETDPDLDWPSDGSVRRWLGSGWNDALKRAHLDAVPDALAMVPEKKNLTREECLSAVKECAAELGLVPSMADYLMWSRREDVKRRPGRRPASQQPFIRYFASWIPALIAAELVRDDGTGAPRGSARRPGGHGYSDDEIYRAMVEVVEHLQEETLPSEPRYEKVRTAILEREEAQGLPPRAFASSGGVTKRFGGWIKTREFYERRRAELARNDESGGER